MVVKVPPRCSHRGEPVQVGPYTIFAGGTNYFQTEDLDGYDIIVPLDGGWAPWKFGAQYTVRVAHLPDYGGVPSGWGALIEGLAAELKDGKDILTFCVGSHGRTGTLLASLIAHLEGRKETPDPIAAVRERHCRKAVETRAQATAIFAIRGEELPHHYLAEFPPPKPKKAMKEQSK